MHISTKVNDLSAYIEYKMVFLRRMCMRVCVCVCLCINQYILIVLEHFRSLLFWDLSLENLFKFLRRIYVFYYNLRESNKLNIKFIILLRL